MGPGEAKLEQRPGRVLLIHPEFIVPVRPREIVLHGHTVIIENDRIVAVLPREEAERAWPDADAVALPGHVLLPGFINAHTHAPMTLLRGLADDLELSVWLREHIWPAESKHVGPRFVSEGTRLAIAEMLRSGTTCFNDMYFFPDATIGVCRETGMRASIGITVIEIESAWATDVGNYIEKGMKLYDRWREEPLISFTLSPHSPYTVSDETLRRIAILSSELDFQVHMHLLETEWEIKQSFQQHGIHPIKRLEQEGFLNERLQAVHMAQLSSDDIEKFARTGANVVHCPNSNLKLASGFCPAAALLDAGVNVAIGTDGAASNNSLDMLAEAQAAALLAKGVSGDAKSVGAFQALEMLTINGAIALGLDCDIGSIEPGKQADLCALDLHQPETQPLHHVVSQVMYAASSRQVTDVWVAGKRLLKSGELTTINMDEVLESARYWQQRLSGKETGSPDV